MYWFDFLVATAVIFASNTLVVVAGWWSENEEGEGQIANIEKM
jgi:hypothetical protein